jgi:hypothetical protein
VEPVPDDERRPDRPLRVVLVGCRNAEECHGGVAGGLLDGPTEAFEIGTNVGVVGAEDSANVLRIELPVGRGEIGEVGEQDGDEFPLFARRAPARRGRTAADEGGVVAEDPPVELHHALARLDPELADQRPPSLTVRGERVRLSSGAVQGEHELGAHVLPVGLLRDERLRARVRAPRIARARGRR